MLGPVELRVFRYVQRGLHSCAFEHLRLARSQETSIANMHLELDRQLAAAS